MQPLCSFFSYAGSVLVTNLFPLLFFNIFWLFSKLWNMRSICNNLFDLQWSSELPQKRWHHSYNNINWLNSLKVIFTKQFLTKVTIFCCFDAFSVRPTQILSISSSSETINNTIHVSRLSFSFLWLWCLEFRWILSFFYSTACQKFQMKEIFIKI